MVVKSDVVDPKKYRMFAANSSKESVYDLEDPMRRNLLESSDEGEQGIAVSIFESSGWIQDECKRSRRTHIALDIIPDEVKTMEETKLEAVRLEDQSELPDESFGVIYTEEESKKVIRRFPVSTNVLDTPEKKAYVESKVRAAKDLDPEDKERILTQLATPDEDWAPIQVKLDRDNYRHLLDLLDEMASDLKFSQEPSVQEAGSEATKEEAGTVEELASTEETVEEKVEEKSDETPVEEKTEETSEEATKEASPVEEAIAPSTEETADEVLPVVEATDEASTEEVVEEAVSTEVTEDLPTEEKEIIAPVSETVPTVEESVKVIVTDDEEVQSLRDEISELEEALSRERQSRKDLLVEVVSSKKHAASQTKTVEELTQFYSRFDVEVLEAFHQECELYKPADVAVTSIEQVHNPIADAMSRAEAVEEVSGPKDGSASEETKIESTNDLAEDKEIAEIARVFRFSLNTRADKTQ
jgi:hypothetical protein